MSQKTEWEEKGARAVRRSYVSYQWDYLVDLWTLNFEIGLSKQQFPPIGDHCLPELVQNHTWPPQVKLNPGRAGPDVSETASHFCHRAGGVPSEGRKTDTS